MESSEIARLTAELAAEREKSATAERQRDEMAAALKVAEGVIGEAMKAASVMNLNKAGGLLSAYQMMGRDYSLILTAHNAEQRRAGAVAGLRGALDDCESVVYADLVPGVAVGERKLLDRIARIERGEVIL